VYYRPSFTAILQVLIGCGFVGFISSRSLPRCVRASEIAALKFCSDHLVYAWL